ncbi:MAG: hypothetical protein ACOX6S_02690 [Clostridia bacterium]|jgi:hypothetical protein
MDLNELRRMMREKGIRDIDDMDISEEKKKELRRLAEAAKSMGISNEKDAMNMVKRMAANKEVNISDEKLNQFKEALEPILNQQQKRKLESIMNFLKDKK